MPGAGTPLPGLLFLLSLVTAYHLYTDMTAVPEEEIEEETPVHRASRLLKVLPDDIETVMPDGRVLLKDGSIRKL